VIGADGSRLTTGFLMTRLRVCPLGLPVSNFRMGFLPDCVTTSGPRGLPTQNFRPKRDSAALD